MTKTINEEIPGFRNYDKWIEGYKPFLRWLINELKCIRTNKPTTTEEEWSELSHTLLNSTLKGAVELQYVGQRDFYYDGQDMEILIRFKKDSKGTKKEIAWSLMKDVILLLEKEEQQLVRIANTYE